MADLDKMGDETNFDYRKQIDYENRSQNNIFFYSRIINLSFSGVTYNTTQLAKYPHVLYAKPSNKVYILDMYVKS